MDDIRYVTGGQTIQVPFSLLDSSDNLVSHAFVAGDVKISVGGTTAPVNTTNLPTQAGTSGTYSITIAPSEIPAFSRSHLIISDSVGSAFKGKVIFLDTLGANIHSLQGDSIPIARLKQWMNAFTSSYVNSATTNNVFNAPITVGLAPGAVILWNSSSANPKYASVIKSVSGSTVTLQDPLPNNISTGDGYLIVPAPVAHDLSAALDRPNTALTGVPNPETASLRETLQAIGYVAVFKKETNADGTIHRLFRENGSTVFGTRNVSVSPAKVVTFDKLVD